MTVHLYTGSLGLVRRSGVGQAVAHQRRMLEANGVTVVTTWQKADAVHINTVLPDAPFAALLARLRGEPVVYYGHSTEQDFRNSFVGSNALAPLFGRWLRFCYNRGDIVLTPTPYAKSILDTYGLRAPVRALSNGVDTGFFAPNPAAGAAFRARYGLSETTRVVVSAGHYMVRKGILDFIALARALPGAEWFWFGYTDPALVPAEVRAAMAEAPANLHFSGFVDQAALRDAYCGADLFCFASLEETEGIVVLEALGCGVPVLVRDIPVYAGWLADGVNVYKAADFEGFLQKAEGILSGRLPDLTAAGRAVAEARSLPALGRQMLEIYAALPARRAAGGRQTSLRNC